MALTTARAGLTPQQWDDEFFKAYVRENRFAPYMGTDENSVIQVKEDLTKKRGDSLTFALVNELTGAGQTTGLLEGNEEALDSRSHKLTVGPIRHAVALTEWDEQKSAIDLRNAGKAMLKMWMMSKMRNDIITALGSINGVAYGTASAAQRNAWVVDNVDRVLFGKLKSNYNATHATALANLDNTDDKLTTASISLMKRIAQNASNKIRPIKTKGDQEWFVLYANSLSFRDVSLDTAMQQANRDARARGVMDNPIFVGGELVWDGVIIREIPEIASLGAVGSGGTVTVSPCYLCGAQAVGVGFAQRSKTTTEVRDYGFVNGVAVQEMRGIQKLTFGSTTVDTDDLKDNGVVTGYFAAVADA